MEGIPVESITVIDLSGRKVMEIGMVSASEIELDLPEAGGFIVRLTTDQKDLYQRVVVVK